MNPHGNDTTAARRPLTDAELDDVLNAANEDLRERLQSSVDTRSHLAAIIGDELVEVQRHGQRLGPLTRRLRTAVMILVWAGSALGVLTLIAIGASKDSPPVIEVATSAVTGVVVAVVGGAIIAFTIPVWTFSRNARMLTRKGSELATSVHEVQHLMDHQAVAFHRVATAFFPWRPDRSSAIEPALSAPPWPAVLGKRPSAPATARATHPAPVVEPSPSWPNAAPALAGSSPDPTLDQGERDVAQKETFWHLLTAAERAALKAMATERTFLTGQEMCREGEPADHVFLIRSGWTRVSVRTPRGERVIARRGPGDLVGERAAMRLGVRSATITADEIVHAFVLTTEDFLSFVRSHPRALDLVNRQIYDRLTEDRPQASRHQTRHAALPPPRSTWTGQNCTILLAGVAPRAHLRRAEESRPILRMLRILRDAFVDADLVWDACQWDARGDGILIVVPPTIPTSIVVDPLLTHVAAGLEWYNQRVGDAARVQLRMALDVGPVVSDDLGMTGEGITFADRLLGATVLKRRLTETRADLGIIASSFVYDTAIRSDRSHVDPLGFERVKFRKDASSITAWVSLIGRSPLGAGISSK